MPRSAGWTILAKEALELAFLALARWATQSEPQAHAPASVAAEVSREPAPPSAAEELPDPESFIHEIADAQTRIYRASDREGVLTAAFYADGRIRMTDGSNCFAGMVSNGHAHLLQLGSEIWSEVFVRTTPEGSLQLELRDGPHDGRVLACEQLGTLGMKS